MSKGEKVTGSKVSKFKGAKVLNSLREAILQADLQDGAEISFHHHLRNGDACMNMFLKELDDLGLKDIKVHASAFFDCQADTILRLISKGCITGLSCNYMSSALGREISKGILERPVIFRTHGGRASDFASGSLSANLAVIAAPTADSMGNISGKFGPSACGSIGYAFADAMYAKQVLAVTDNLIPGFLSDFSIPEIYVDYVVEVESLGDPSGIVSGTTKLTRDPIALMIADQAAKVIEASKLLQDGFSFQTGAGGASLATAAIVGEKMKRQGICGDFAMGGITEMHVELLESGCFTSIADVQCFDLAAVNSIRNNPRHREISAMQYAASSLMDKPKLEKEAAAYLSPEKISALNSLSSDIQDSLSIEPRQFKSSRCDALDVVILGATEMDCSFNVNVHTDSNGFIMGGSGGHSDTAAGAKLAIIAAPLIRAGIPLIRDEISCISTPGYSIDVLVTQFGTAVNSLRSELAESLIDAGIKVNSIEELKNIAEKYTGKFTGNFIDARGEGLISQNSPEKRAVGLVRYPTGEILDVIMSK